MPHFFHSYLGQLLCNTHYVEVVFYLLMDASQSQQWQRLYQQKMNIFLDERCRRAPGVTDPAKLQASFSDMESQYSQPGFSNILRGFQPSLNNVESFTLVISSATQSVPVSGLVWGAIQAVVEV